MSDEPLLSASQIAERIGRHPKTVLLWARNDIIPRKTLSGRWVRFHWSAVEKAMDAQGINKTKP